MKARPLTLSALFLFTALALIASVAMAADLPPAAGAPAVAAAPEAPAGDLCLPLSSPVATRSADLPIDLFQPTPKAAAAVCNCALGPCPVTNCPHCSATQHCAPIACLGSSSTPWINGVCI
jgi:hypothetical protein